MGTDLLALHRKTAIDKLIDSIPKPKRSLPENPLPGCEHFHIAAKLPHQHKSIKTTEYSLAKLSQKPNNLPFNDFFRKDPNNFNISSEYHQLHDVALKSYLQHPQKLKVIKSLGQINEKGEVICSQKEFNDYRRYLSELHLSRVHEIIKAKDQLEQLNRSTQFAMRHAEVTRRVRAKERQWAAKKERLQTAEKIKKEEIRRKIEIKIKREHRKCRKQSNKTINLVKLKQETILHDQIKLKQQLQDDSKLRQKKLQQFRADKQNRLREKDLDFWERKVESLRENTKKNEECLKIADVTTQKRITRHHEHCMRRWSRGEFEKLKIQSAAIRNRYESSNIAIFHHVMCQEVRRFISKEEARNIESNNTGREGLSPLLPFTGERGMEWEFPVKKKYPVKTTNAEIKEFIEMSIQNVTDLYGIRISVLDVVKLAKRVILRHASGGLISLPTDDYVVKYVAKFLWNEIRDIEQDIIWHVKDSMKIREEDLQKYSAAGSTKHPVRHSVMKSTNTPDNKRFRAEVGAKVRFTQTTPDKQYTNLPSAKSTEKLVHLRQMVRSELEATIDLDPHLSSIRSDLDIPDLFHLSPTQKTAVSLMLRNLSIYVQDRTKRICYSSIDVQNLRIIPDDHELPEPTELTNDEVFEATARSLLQLKSAGYSRKCVHNIVRLSRVARMHILDQMALIFLEEKTRA